jgi:hypothetical protein
MRHCISRQLIDATATPCKAAYAFIDLHLLAVAQSERTSFFFICVAAAFWQGREPTRGHGSRTAFPLFMFRCTCVLVNARPPPEGTCRRTAPTPASSISRRARSTRDTLPWAACTFHILGDKVLHKTRCAKDQGRSKDTFGNRFEVY